MRPKTHEFAEYILEKKLPMPTTKRPTVERLKKWMRECYSCTTDGCRVEPDGWCMHGHPSWLLYLGFI